MYNVFHNTLLRLVANNLFPSQILHDARPDPILDEDNEEIWKLEEILDIKIESKKDRRGLLYHWFLC